LNCPLIQKRKDGGGRRGEDLVPEAGPGTDIGSKTDQDTKRKDPGQSIKNQKSTRLRREDNNQTIATRTLKLTEEEISPIALTETGGRSVQENTLLKIWTVMGLIKDDPCQGMRKLLR